TAGLLRPVPDPVRACVELGLAMNAVTRKIASHWQIRTGIHAGPVVAGVLGKQQFLFDLWGDTVNTAFRMVGQAEPGTIALSGSAWERIAPAARQRSRSTVEVKGKGPMEVVLFEEFVTP
ncbi:MAG: adenylate/guanylate cyclase domain-containing protein, partial [Planctomycetota bacterium JB042]